MYTFAYLKSKCVLSMLTDTKLRKALGKKREEIEIVSDSHGLNARISQAGKSPSLSLSLDRQSRETQCG